MFLSKDIAGKIIEEISKVIDYNINIMDECGLIIASTNSVRLNTYHEGAFLIIRKNLKELKVYDTEEYAGCQKGINLPIVLDGNLIGVIGITGEVEEVINYGKVIKKMTEILVEDLSTKEHHKINEQSKLLFVNQWISGEFENNHLFFEQNAKRYNIDLNSGFTLAVFKVLPKNLDTVPDYKAIDAVITYISEKLNQRRLLFASNSNNNILISYHLDSAHLFEILTSLSKQIAGQFPFTVVCGIGHRYPDYRDVPKSYGEALKVMNFFNDLSPGIYLYDESIVSLMIDEIPLIYKNQCINRIFQKCSRKEIEDFTGFITTYYNNNGSINKIADQLYVHKNTVQYKINKIINRTGLDIRIYKDMIELLLASNFIRRSL
jgi:carbohydrate diacid regulator